MNRAQKALYAFVVVLVIGLSGFVIGYVAGNRESEASVKWRDSAQVVLADSIRLNNTIKAAAVHIGQRDSVIRSLEARNDSALASVQPTNLAEVRETVASLPDDQSRVIYLDGVVARMKVTETRLLTVIVGKDLVIREWQAKYAILEAVQDTTLQRVHTLEKMIADAPAIKECRVVGIKCPSRGLAAALGAVATLIVVKF